MLLKLSYDFIRCLKSSAEVTMKAIGKMVVYTLDVFCAVLDIASFIYRKTIHLLRWFARCFGVSFVHIMVESSAGYLLDSVIPVVVFRLLSSDKKSGTLEESLCRTTETLNSDHLTLDMACTSTHEEHESTESLLSGETNSYFQIPSETTVNSPPSTRCSNPDPAETSIHPEQTAFDATLNAPPVARISTPDPSIASTHPESIDNNEGSEKQLQIVQELRSSVTTTRPESVCNNEEEEKLSPINADFNSLACNTSCAETKSTELETLIGPTPQLDQNPLDATHPELVGNNDKDANLSPVNTELGCDSSREQNELTELEPSIGPSSCSSIEQSGFVAAHHSPSTRCSTPDPFVVPTHQVSIENNEDDQKVSQENAEFDCSSSCVENKSAELATLLESKPQLDQTSSETTVDSPTATRSSTPDSSPATSGAAEEKSVDYDNFAHSADAEEVMAPSAQRGMPLDSSSSFLDPISAKDSIPYDFGGNNNAPSWQAANNSATNSPGHVDDVHINSIATTVDLVGPNLEKFTTIITSGQFDLSAREPTLCHESSTIAETSLPTLNDSDDTPTTPSSMSKPTSPSSNQQSSDNSSHQMQQNFSQVCNPVTSPKSNQPKLPLKPVYSPAERLLLTCDTTTSPKSTIHKLPPKPYSTSKKNLAHNPAIPPKPKFHDKSAGDSADKIRLLVADIPQLPSKRGSKTEYREIPVSLAGAVIGYKGAGVKMISQISEARVWVQQEQKRSTARPVQITGTGEQIERAWGMIQEKLRRAQ
ncbi:hypothetical protein HK098_004704 [Nowakowskiella sp. JEL0407]|nr:hypothetical protein HK098_004704 [Nowakowskiella sp. JEL0407]